MNMFLGIDIGSISTNMVLIDHETHVVHAYYERTQGSPIESLKRGFSSLRGFFSSEPSIVGVGTTGSARNLVGTIVGADIIKNEITAHGLAAIQLYPQVQTVLEIGGQDSKIIIIRDGIITDFGMNTVCAAGTGSFLDHQAYRLGIPIEEMGSYALSATSACPIAGRCTVFAESDMIHKQQLGYDKAEIVAGLCEALVRNYLNNVAKGKEIKPPLVFQGGVAANLGIKKAFEVILGQNIIIPRHYNVMGAFGAALLAREYIQDSSGPSRFRGLTIADINVVTRGFYCGKCPNNCEIIEIILDDTVVALTGDRCGRYSANTPAPEQPNRIYQPMGV
ncbi:2-hydroxyglutaryl-CoA dehydratase [bacterium]|nr:2-hydroxyglutaryl-CoA dehydratase [bacterium]